MKSYTVQPETDSNQGVFIYRLVLAMIMMVCLSYATFAQQPANYTSGISAVEFKSFEVEQHSGSVILKWSVENESEVSHYIIEKSIGGKEYQTAAYMFPYEMQDKANAYQYTDKKKDTGSRIGYRIVSVHKNGSTSTTPAKF
ncbi:MAG: hypothetical protein ACXWV5_06870 [Flavitalea sp.]